MSIESDRRQLESKQNAQADAAKKAAGLRQKEAAKRTVAAKARESAGRTRSVSIAQSKFREAERADAAANSYGRDAGKLEVKAAAYAGEAAKLQAKIAKAQSAEDSRRARIQQAEARNARKLMQNALAEQHRLTAHVASTDRRIAGVEAATDTVFRALDRPRTNRLRVLMLGASPKGDLRIAREHTRIRKAVEVAVHRDLVEIEPRLSATSADLQEGIAKFRPQVVHFSGHGTEQLIGLEDDEDDFHDGVVITAQAFASACAATDTPPTVIVLNACQSERVAFAVVERFAPIAIGMRDSIEDTDAMHYATAFYSSIANGHSVASAHRAGKAAIELAGGEHELPQLIVAPGVDAESVRLVAPPE